MGPDGIWITKMCSRIHLAAVIAEDIGTEVDYMDVETDGAARAAAMLADLV